jgi:probable F420-dependent oxidoreductase
MAIVTPQLSLHLRSFSVDSVADWGPLLEQARAADQAGIDRVAVSDHVVFGEQLDEYGRPEIGGMPGGKQPTGPDGSWLEPLTTLSFIAASTTRVRVGTSVLLAALRRPAVLAKTASTLDVLSGGRLDLGVGVGWQREEYEASGLDFDRRGASLEQSLRVCQALWANQSASFDDGHLVFKQIHQMPKPLQPGGVPLWISGTVNQRVIRRLAEFGSGWIPWGLDAVNLTDSIARMREGVTATGRDFASIGVVGSLSVPFENGQPNFEHAMEPVPAMRASGVTDFRPIIQIPPNFDQALDLLCKLVESFRNVT